MLEMPISYAQYEEDILALNRQLEVLRTAVTFDRLVATDFRDFDKVNIHINPV